MASNRHGPAVQTGQRGQVSGWLGILGCLVKWCFSACFSRKSCVNQQKAPICLQWPQGVTSLEIATSHMVDLRILLSRLIRSRQKDVTPIQFLVYEFGARPTVANLARTENSPLGSSKRS